MANYIVRLTETGEIVGLFSASTDEELFWMVDECVDPWACECRRIRGWGIMWPKPNAPKVPLPEIEDDVSLSGATLTELAQMEFLSDGKWKPVAIESKAKAYYA
jgi:hypothetical protein